MRRVAQSPPVGAAAWCGRQFSPRVGFGKWVREAADLMFVLAPRNRGCSGERPGMDARESPRPSRRESLSGRADLLLKHSGRACARPRAHFGRCFYQLRERTQSPSVLPRTCVAQDVSEMGQARKAAPFAGPSRSAPLSVRSRTGNYRSRLWYPADLKPVPARCHEIRPVRDGIDALGPTAQLQGEPRRIRPGHCTGSHPERSR